MSSALSQLPAAGLMGEPTMILATCPRCRASITLAEDRLGKSIRCPNCQCAFKDAAFRAKNEAELSPAPIDASKNASPEGTSAGRRDQPPVRRATGAVVAVLAAIVSFALVLGAAAGASIIYLCIRASSPPAVADERPAQPDAAVEQQAVRRPDPPPLAQHPDPNHARHDQEQPPPPEPAPKPAGPPQQASLSSDNVLEDLTNILPLPNIGGWVMLPDGVTLIVALPDEAKLAYIDTVANKELKRVKLSFKPECLAVQGKRLFASAQGASAVHVLDVDSGANKKEIKLPDGFVTSMACHTEKGLVYLVMSEQRTIHTLDPETGRTALAGIYALQVLSFPAPHFPAIKATAQYLAVDPRDGNTFYGAYFSGGEKRHEGTVEETYGQGLEKLQVKTKVELYPGEIPGMQRTVSVPAGPFQPLARTAVNRNAVPLSHDRGGFYPVRISSDGKRVGVIGRGEVQILEADNIGSGAGVGKCPDPTDLAFHPVLDLMAVEGSNGSSGNALYLFNGKSLTQITKISFDSGAAAKAPAVGRLLTFGARGTKVVYYDWSQGGLLRFLLVKLTQKDREMLSKAYGVEIRPITVAGAIEAESMKILAKSGDYPINVQDMTSFGNGQWSGDCQLWGKATKVGDWADLELSASEDGKYHLIVYLTRSWDYGIAQFHLNGTKLGSPIDCYHADTVVRTGPIDLGEAVLKKGENTLRVEMVGTNPKSAAPHYSWGVDCIALK
jgi:hypothetical protein